MQHLRTLALGAIAAACLTLAQAQGMRPEVGKPLQQANELLRAGKAKEAMAKVREAEAVGGKTAAEQLTLDRMKAAVAQRAGEPATAAAALESLYGKVGGGEQAQVAEQIAFAYSQMRDWPRTQQWIQKAQAAGGGSAQLRQLASYVQSQTGDYAAIGREAQAAVSAAEQGGRRPDEGDLLRLADAQQRSNNINGYVNTLEKLVIYYPKKDYWTAYLGRLPRKSGFADRLALDVMRLRLATGTLGKTEDFMEMAQLSLQAGFAAEGMKIIEKGYAAGALGTGAEADRHKRLKELAEKKLAESKSAIANQASDAANEKDGNALVQVGYTYVTLGEVEKGIELIEAGIKKGGLKRPEDAKLRLGMAQLQSPKARAKAAQTLRSVTGTDGVADVARLWVVLGSAS
jgi:hypothetical protein